MTHQPPHVLKAVDADLPAILAISRTTPWNKDDYLRDQLARGNVLVATAGDTVCGFAAWNREFFALPFLWLIVVAHDFRRQGIASKLFDAIEAECAGTRLFSSTNLSNAAMQKLLERRGYRRSGELDLDPGDPEIFFTRLPEF